MPRTVDTATPEHVDVAGVGGGIGGSLTDPSLAAGGLRVVLLERGEACPPGSLAHSSVQMQRSVRHSREGLHGLSDVWSYRGTEAVAAPSEGAPAPRPTPGSRAGLTGAGRAG